MKKNKSIYAEKSVSDLDNRHILQEHEAALLIGVCDRSLRRLRQQKLIPFAQVGRRVVYSKAALIQWIENGGCNQKASA